MPGKQELFVPFPIAEKGVTTGISLVAVAVATVLLVDVRTFVEVVLTVGVTVHTAADAAGLVEVALGLRRGGRPGVFELLLATGAPCTRQRDASRAVEKSVEEKCIFTRKNGHLVRKRNRKGEEKKRR